MMDKMGKGRKGGQLNSCITVSIELKHKRHSHFPFAKQSKYIRVWHSARQRGEEKEKQRVRERDLP